MARQSGTCSKRCKADRILSYNSGNILVVTHSVVIKCLLSIFKTFPIGKLLNPPNIQDTSLTVVEVHDKGYNILSEGDISHKEVVKLKPISLLEKSVFTYTIIAYIYVSERKVFPSSLPSPK
ncbi:histidine phosphatase family protein [Psychrobacillus mangrovi]|uniref:histidine phosphatase family protein n=1 Tax=Psychrobacillus mangrovi TaxID=3117745 RepID=UPI0039B72441